MFAVCTGKRNGSICCLYWKKECVHLLSVPGRECVYFLSVREQECVCLLSVPDRECVSLHWKVNVSVCRLCWKRNLYVCSGKGMCPLLSIMEGIALCNCCLRKECGCMLSAQRNICCQLSVERKCGCLWKGNVDFFVCCQCEKEMCQFAV